MPGAPPHDVQVKVLSSSSFSIQWLPPPSEKHHGQIIYYKICYQELDDTVSNAAKTDRDNSVVLEKLFEVNANSQNIPYEITIANLKKWTKYRVQILAGTKVGDGPLSQPISVRTEDDGKGAKLLFCLGLSGYLSDTTFFC